MGEGAKKINPYTLVAPTKLDDPNLELNFGLSDAFSSQEEKNNNNVVENNFLGHDGNRSFGARSVDVTINTGLVFEGQATGSVCLDLNLGTPEEDPNIFRRNANRIYLKNYRLKQNAYIANLEMAATRLMRKNVITLQEIEEYINKKKTLLLANEELKSKIAALEKEMILKKAETKKNIALIEKLKKLQTQVPVPDLGSDKPK